MVDLAPWDRLPYFFQPSEASYALSTTPILVAKGDPQRVLLVFFSGATGLEPLTLTFPIPIAFSVQYLTVPLQQIVVSTLPTVPVPGGFAVSPLGTPFVLDANTYGPAVTVPWYAAIGQPGSQQLTVLSVSMQSWPSEQAAPNLIQQVDNGSFRPMANGRANSNGRAKLYGNCWSKRETPSPYCLSDLVESGLS